MSFGMGQSEHTMEQHACFSEYLKLYEDQLADYIGDELLFVVSTSSQDFFATLSSSFVFFFL